jgi:hypothetical protein
MRALEFPGISEEEEMAEFDGWDGVFQKTENLVMPKRVVQESKALPLTL